MPQKSDELLDRIKKAARLGQVITTKHARDEMEAARASAKSVEHAIQTATKAIERNDNGTVRLEGGTDIDGDELTVVVAEDPRGLRLVTVF